MGSFDKLLEQIDAFIKKFYKNQMIKGIILFIGVFLLSFLVTTSLEYFGRFGSLTRGVLFFSFLGVNAWICSNYLVLPIMKLYSFGKRIDRYQASEIIGSFFPGISDRLKNTLQLQDDLQSNEGNIELLRASVMQRSESLSVMPFTSAIDIRDNRKYAKYLLPLFLLIFIIGIAAPGLFTQGTERVVNYSKEFKPEAPFSFSLTTTDLDIEEGEDLPVKLELKGSQLPENVYLISENGKFLMQKTAKNQFVGIVKKPKKSGAFLFEANQFSSEKFKITVYGKSAIGHLQAKLIYPIYLGRTNETVENAGDMTVPEGTIIEWNLKTKNTKWLDFLFNGSKERFVAEGMRTTKKVMNNSKVKIILSNKHRNKLDSTVMAISVVKDTYPVIQVNEVTDSVSDGVRFFSGRVSDDYGLSSLSFAYTIISENAADKHVSLPVRRVMGVDMSFDFAVDFRRENVKLNDRIEYYFVVTDNDGVNGSKATKTQLFTYKLPNLDELNEKRDEEQKEIKDNLSDILKRTQEFQKNVDKLKKEVLNSKKNDWNKTNQVNQLKEEQKSILESLQQAQQLMDKSVEEKNQLSEIDKDLLEKQDLIEKLLEEVMDDELRKLLGDLEKLMSENNKEELKKKLDDIEQSSEDMNKQLDRSLEMLKKLQVNEKIDDIEKELKDLSKDQNELKEQIEKGLLDDQKSIEKQDELNNKFEDIKKDLDKLKELNDALEDPLNLGDTEPSEQEISKDMDQSSESLQNSKSKKAGESQKSASEKMKGLADQLDMMQDMANQEQQEDDMNLLRSILEGLMILSFGQEEVMQRFMKVSDSDPAYRRYGRKQRMLIDETTVIRDSLLALAKKQPKIASFVDKELNEIKNNHSLALEDIDEHRKRDLGVHQQKVMTAYNNLALLLNESLQSMQQQMQNSKPGEGSCNKPGGKGQPKPGLGMSSGDMKEMLKKQLEQMQKGQSPNGNKPGDKPGEKQGENGMGMPGLGNKEIAKMAAEQTAIRQRLEQLRNELNKEGNGKGNKLNPLIKELEEQEREIINKKFSSETIKRQKDILTRLLESEKAIMERGFEEKRESETGKNQNYSNQIRFNEYNRQKLRQIDLLRSVDPVYRKYYKDKANEYFNQGL